MAPNENMWPAPLNALRERIGASRVYAAAGEDTSDMRRFLIVTSGRAGSELLTSLLASHPMVMCDTELLSEKRRDPERFVAGRVAQAKRLGKAAYGFKAKPKDILETQEFERAADWIRQKASEGWLIIRLARRDWMQQAISNVRASQTQWHFRDGEAPPFEPIAIDPYVLIGNMCQVAYYERQIDDLLADVTYTPLTYEIDLREPAVQAATVDRLCQALSLPLYPTSTNLVRVHPSETRKMVTNYDEIAEVLRRNEFAHFLEGH